MQALLFPLCPVILCCSFVLVLTDTGKFVFRLLRLRQLECWRDGHLGEVAQVVSWVEEGAAATTASYGGCKCLSWP